MSVLFSDSQKISMDWHTYFMSRCRGPLYCTSLHFHTEVFAPPSAWDQTLSVLRLKQNANSLSEEKNNPAALISTINGCKSVFSFLVILLKFGHKLDNVEDWILYSLATFLFTIWFVNDNPRSPEQGIRRWATSVSWYVFASCTYDYTKQRTIKKLRLNFDNDFNFICILKSLSRIHTFVKKLKHCNKYLRLQTVSKISVTREKLKSMRVIPSTCRNVPQCVGLFL